MALREICMAIKLTDVATLGSHVITEVERAIVGKRMVLEQIMAAILANGHVLLEDYPGLAKTLVASSFARALGLEFRRIQFTPDLLPGDITGSYIFDRASGQFELRRGPIFANIVLADEINRASPKTQSALLEAMQEHQVTLEGDSMQLPTPFIVLATQNPIEYEGTFPLPEAQLDRFLIKISVGYPSAEEEIEILSRRRQRRSDDMQLNQVTSAEEILAMRAAVEEVHVSSVIEAYIVALVRATRQDSRVTVGSSPRGSLALLKLARAQAALDGRDYVLPDDVKRFLGPALTHRIMLTPDLWMQRRAADEVIASIGRSVAVPTV
jgi:MoxR-like ATPase